MFDVGFQTEIEIEKVLLVCMWNCEDMS